MSHDSPTVYRNWFLKLLYPHTTTSISFFNLLGKVVAIPALVALMSVSFYYAFLLNTCVLEWWGQMLGLLGASIMLVSAAALILFSGFCIGTLVYKGCVLIRGLLDFDIHILDKV